METRTKLSTKILLTVLALLLLASLAVGIAHLSKETEENLLENLQNEALDLLADYEGEYDETRIVLTDTTHSEAKALAEKFGASLRITNDGRFAALTLPEGVTIKDIYSEDEYREHLEDMSPDFYAAASDIEPAEGDSEGESSDSRLPARPNYTVTDGGYSQQTYLDYLNMSTVWSTTKGSGITVAVIDTGIDTDHPEFAGKISEFSYNATEDKIVKDYLLEDGSYDWSLIEDEQGHGTAVTGVIAASMNGDGVVGIAPDVTVIVIKAECDANGNFYRSSDLVFGLYYAIERDVNVVNMSFGSYGGNIFKNATRLAVDSDIICVAAAGNDATTAISYPAADPNVIGVGALAEGSWELAEYSNYGENSDIVAPGTTYTTLKDGEYGMMNGTSLASPTVTGGIALYLARNKYATFDSVLENLYASTYDLGDLGDDWYYGFGAFDIYALVCEERGTVTFDVMTDELEDFDQLFVRYHTLQDMPVPERVYSIFDGWYYDIDLIEPVDLYRDEFSSDLTLYAAWTNEDDGVPYTYVELDDGTIEIRSYTGHRRYITMPEYIDGKVVSSIGRGAFEGERDFRIVDLPAQLTTIKDRAFYGCVNLTIAEIPDTVTSIGAEAFYDNSRLQAAVFGVDSRLTTIGDRAFGNCTSLRRFEIPDTVSYLNGSAFFGATGIKQFSIMGESKYFIIYDGVLYNRPETELVAYPAGRVGEYTIRDATTKIGEYAFAFSKLTSIDLDGIETVGRAAFIYGKLESLVLPDSVKALGTSAFEYNSNLKTLVFGDGMTSVAGDAFSACSSLESISLSPRIMSIDSGAFSDSSKLKELIFRGESNLTSIGISAFAGSGLESLELPASLVNIGGSAFANNYYLESVGFADGSALQTIGGSAFSGCISLSDFEFTSNLRAIGGSAFMYTALTTVSLPASLTSLGVAAFAECDVLENIYIDDNNTIYIDIDGVVYNTDKTVIVEYPVGNPRTSYTVEPTVTEIGDGAFWGSDILTGISLPSGLITVGEYGFYHCTAVTRYTLPANLTYIERYAFSENTRLTRIAIPDNVYQISNYAFAYDWKLRSITFTQNAKLPRISFAAFAYTGIQSFTVPASVSTMAQEAFVGCKSLTSLTFAENSKLTSISAYMLKGADSLKTITFGSGTALTSIQAHGFEGMKNLTSINFADAKLTNIDNFAFRYCEKLTGLNIPEGVTYIGRYAFHGCKAMTSLTIPASIDYIGEFAFIHDEKLNVYFAGDALPFHLAENWDYGIKGYYVDVKSVVETDEWNYAELNSGNIAIIEYKGTATDIDLTAFPYGTVSMIGGSAFELSKIESIILPETLTEIHRKAFANSKLKSVMLPDSLEYIGTEAFSWSKIAEVSIGAGTRLKKVEQYAFEGTENLKSFKIPASLEILGKYVFLESGIETVDLTESVLTEIPVGTFMKSKLTSVKLPEGTTKVGDNAFRGCESLTSVEFGTADFTLESNVFYGSGLSAVYIPDNLTHIGEYALVGLENLKEFKVSATHPKYMAIDGIVYSKDGKKLICAPAGKTGEITLPESLEVLGYGAFENSMLSKISFHPESNILTFGYRCFYNAAISEVTVPKTVVSFDFYAFAMCKNLHTVHIAEDNNLKGIYEGAFYGCLNLQRIELPDSVVEISDYAFYGCTSLDRLPVSETTELKGIYDYAFAYMHFDELTLPDTLIDIGNYAFLGSKFKSVTVESGENTETLIIGIGAFEQNNELAEITLPFIGASFEDYDITWFGYIFGAGAYEANSAYVPESLKNVKISEGISFIGTGAFYGLTSLEEIDVPESVTGIYQYAFYNSTVEYELKSEVTLYSVDRYGDTVLETSVYSSFFGKGISGHVRLANSVTSIGSSAFEGCSSLTSITIPDSVTSIGWYAFSGCSSLASITIPDSIITIGNFAFYECSGLTSITIPDSVTSIGWYAFSGCSSLTSITIPEGVTSIGYSAFSGCKSLTSITIPEGVTSIGGYAFENCSSLTVVHITDISAWCAIDFDGIYANPLYYTKNLYLNGELVSGDIVLEGITSIGMYALYNQTGITSITIPDSVLSLGGYAFDGCSSLTSITIPDSVTSIGNYAFRSCSSLTSITIPEGVTSIGNGAFLWCSSLISVTIPDSVTSIGNSAFSWCSSLISVTIPDSVTSIGNSAFSWCSSLTSITIPDSVTSIGDWAFYNCSSLLNFTIPEGVTSIGDYAFDGCASLYEIINNSDLTFTIGSADNGYVAYYARVIVNKDGSKQFKDDENFTYIDTADGFRFSYYNDEYQLIAYLGDKETVTLPLDINGNGYILKNGFGGAKNVIVPEGITSIGSSAFEDCYSLTSITIPEGVTSIGSYAFSSCSGLTSVTIPDSVTSIGNSAFYRCSSLTSITIPDSVTSIGDAAFLGCSSLTSITIPDSVTSIGSSAFSGCTSLTSITIPAGVTSIGSSAFSGCSNLSNVVIGKNVSSIASGAFSGCPIENLTVDEENQYFSFENGILYDKEKTSIKCVCDTVTDVIIPATVTGISSVFKGCTNLKTVVFEEGTQIKNIGSSAFYNCSSLTSITIPESVTSIDSSAFSGCSSITSITIPESVTSIDSSAFSGCSSITSITIPEGVLSLGDAAFSGCSSLTSITIPEGVTSIGQSAFYGCSSLNAVYITDISKWCAIDFSYYSANPLYYTKNLYLNGELVTELIIPEGVTSIGSWVFYGCSSLTSITIPDSVTSIGYGAFDGCSSLTSITIPEGVTSIDWITFSGCSSLTCITIPDSVTSIGNYAFSGCSSITSITIPEGVLSLGDAAFSGCSSLTSITIPEGVTSIGDDAFSGCSSLTSITIPDSVTSIGSWAFYHCYSLTSITIPEGVTSIGSGAFSGCSSLTSITIPNSVTSIGSSAFYGCSSLTSITIPEGVTSIGDDAFSSCSGLTSVTIPDSVLSLGDYAFSGCSSLTSITIPEGVTSIDNYAFRYCSSLYVIYNNSSLTLTFGSSGNGYVADYAKAIVDNDGNVTYNNTSYATYTLTDDGFLFEYSDSKYTLIAYAGGEETVTLPSNINGEAYEICRMRGVVNVIIPEGITSIGSSAFSGCFTLTSITIPDSVTSIGSSAFISCSSLESITIPDSVLSLGNYAFCWCSSLTTVNFGENSQLTSIGSSAFTGTAYYSDPDNWKNGALYIGNHLIKVDENVTEFKIRVGTKAIASGAFSGCYKLKRLTIGGNHSSLLSDLTNLETLVLTELPIYLGYVNGYFDYGYIYEYFGNTSNIPITLKNIVIKSGCNVTRSNLFSGITGVNIYVEDRYDTVKHWDKVYSGWNNGNNVFYGGEWISADFLDEDGSTIGYGYYLTSNIVRQPYVPNKVEGDITRVFIGWDTNGDGLVDRIPAISSSNIRATAVYAEHRLSVPEIVESTCTETGYRKVICLECGEIVEYRILAALGHISSGIIESVAPSCESEGYDLHSCANCSKTFKRNIQPATEHTYGEWVTVKESTCKDAGERYRICTVCSYTETEKTEKSNHNYIGTVTKSATCEKEGETLYTCSVCNDKYTESIEKTAHNYEKTYASKSFIQWLIELFLNIICGYEGNQAFYYKCTECGRLMTESEASSFGIASVAGVKCSHELGEWTVAKAPTCADGIEIRRCVKCNTAVESRAVAPSGAEHTLEWNGYLAPTCTAAGMDAHYYCTECGKRFDSNMTEAEFDDIPALGHDLIHHEAQAQTCTEIGWNSYDTCSRCEYTTYRTIPANGHTDSDWITDSEPTCTSTGTKHKECTVCGATTANGTISSLGHDLTAHEGKATTCTEGGWAAYNTCSRCDYNTYRSIEPMGHRVGNGNVSLTNDSVYPFELADGIYYSANHNHGSSSVFTVVANCDCTLTVTYSTSSESNYDKLIIKHNGTQKAVLSGSQSNKVLTLTLVAGDTVTISYTKDGSVSTGDDRGWFSAITVENNSSIASTSIVTMPEHCTEDITCDYCGTVISAGGHAYGEWIVDATPNCTTEGSKHRECSRCENTETEAIPATGHSYTSVVTAPTCTAQGYTTYTCHCGDTYKADYVNALGHSYTSVITAPTCTAQGYTTYTCHCGDTYKADYVNALGHTSVTDKAVAPTCTNTGLTEGSHCSVCNTTLVAQIVVPATGHTSVTDKAVAPTCTKTGLTEGSHCSVCNITLVAQIVVPATGHTSVTDKAVAPTCTKTGLTEGSHCSVCNTILVAQIVVPATGHSSVTNKAVAPTCTNTGLTEGSHCSVCGETLAAQTVILATGHTESEWIIDSNATCTLAGSKHTVCTVCNVTLDTEVISATGHSYTSVVTAPTCTAQGYTTYTCHCGDTYKADYVNALGHTVVVDNRVAPTCTETGLTEGSHCSVCNTILVAQIVVPATGHTSVTDKAVAPTCTNTGLTEGSHCSVCNTILVAQIVVPATGHSSVTNKAVAPTCTNTGLTEGSHCSVCGETLVAQTVIPANGHTESEWIIDSNATCTLAGSKHTVCTVCNITLDTEVISATGHSYTSVVTASTCTAQGYTTYTCHCGDTYKADYVNALGHTVVVDNRVAPTCTETGLTEGSHCSVCGEILVEQIVTSAKGHSHIENIIAPTCTSEGYTSYICHCGDRYTVDYVDALGHDIVISSSYAPTCTQMGMTYYTCSRCTYAYYDEIPATGHSYTSVVTAPTCTAQGYTTYTCHCGDTYKADYVDALGHTSVTDKAVAPTCTEAGLTEGSHCSVCGTVISEQKLAPALGHALASHEAKEPTYTDGGWNAYEGCTRCDYTTFKAIPALGLTAKFIDEVEAIGNGSMEERYAQIIKPIRTYNALTDSEKESVSEHYETLCEFVDFYNGEAGVINDEHDAVILARVEIILGYLEIFSLGYFDKKIHGGV